MKLLVTGASGFLGSYLLPELRQDGHQITALVRRISPSPEGISILPGDVTLPRLGLNGPLPQVDAIVHCAGLVEFRDRPELHLTNVVAVGYVTRLSLELGVPLFHVSTAYVCGALQGVVGPDDLDQGQIHRNAYERSKYSAECIIRDEPGLQYTIIRPSILVGDSRLRGMPPLNGFYVILRACYLSKRWLERNLQLPALEPHIRLPGNPDGTLNLMPVDLAARQIADLVKANVRGAYFVTNEHPPALREVASAASRALDARIEIVPHLAPNPAERIALRLARDLVPYMAGGPDFDNRATWPFTEARCHGLGPDFIEATTRHFLGG